MANGVNVLDRAPNIVIRALNLALSSFEDPEGLLRPLWRDYSRWQGKIAFDIAAANGVLGYAARSTISWGYQDPWFPRNWAEGKPLGMYRTSYHVLYPGESVIAQADNWYKVHPEIDLIPRVIDFELGHDIPYPKIAEALWNLSNVVLARDGVRPIIYTRYLLVNSWLASWSTEMLNEHYWWFAQFLWDRTREHPGEPTLPERVTEDRVILHQTADKKVGFSGEVESGSVDWDRWEIGNASEMHEWIDGVWGDGVVDPPDPPAPPVICECDDQFDSVNERIDVLSLDLLDTNAAVMRNQVRIEAIDQRVTSLEEAADPTGGSYALFTVTDEKTLAFFDTGFNESGYLKIADNIYEPRIRWDQGDKLIAYPEPKIRADGGSRWYVLVPGSNGKNTVPTDPVLYVNAGDVMFG